MAQETRLIQMFLESIMKVKDNLMKSLIALLSLNPFGCVSVLIWLLHDFTMREGFNETRKSGLNLIRSFANLRIKWSKVKHCETTILIVFIFLNKLDLANACLKCSIDTRTNLTQLTSGSKVS